MFPSASLNTELTCSDENVANVGISIDGADAGTFGCIQTDTQGNPGQGLILTGLSRAPHQVQVDALDSSGNVVSSNAVQYNPVAGCGSYDSVDVNLAQDLVIPYAFQPPASCTAPTPQSAYPTTLVWFELLDPSGHVYSVADQTTLRTTTPIACDASMALTVPAALYETFTLTRIQEVEVDFSGSTFFTYHYNCTPSVFQHVPGSDQWTPAVRMVEQATPGTTMCF